MQDKRPSISRLPEGLPIGPGQAGAEDSATDPVIAAVKIAFEVRERQLEAYARSEPLPPFLLQEIADKLQSVRQERAQWEREVGERRAHASGGQSGV